MTRGQRNIEWIEANCCVPDGPRVGQLVILTPHQRADILAIYDNPHGTRRVIISYGRKNGKTMFAALLILLHLVGPESIQNGQLYSAARSKDQAAIVFAYAGQMVRASPTLGDHVGIRDNDAELYSPGRGTEYKALSAEAKTKFGLNPCFIVHDELGQVEGPFDKLYEALETATGAQLNALSVIISTQAATNADLMSLLIDAARSTEDPDPTTVLRIYECPDDFADVFTDEALRLANPAFDQFQNADELRRMARDARKMPTRESSYRNLVLNQRCQARASFVSRATWEALKGEVGEPLPGVKQALGLDLSEVNDLTALVRSWDNGDGKTRIKAHFWLPEEGIRERSIRDKVPYDVWAKQGWITLIPGKTIDYEHIVPEVVAMFKTGSVAAAGFDRWNWKHFVKALERGKFPNRHMDKWKQIAMGGSTMAPALRSLEQKILESTLVHDGNPVMNMCVGNAVVSSSDKSNRRLEKARARGRIDGLVALAIAEATSVEVPVKRKPRILVQ